MIAPESGYRKRNIALAVVAIAVAVAAVIRLAYAPQSGTPPTETATVAIAAVPAGSTEAQSGDAATEATRATIAADVAYAGSVDALPDTAKVYVFIRPVGQRMPLAVQVYGVGDLPVRVEFTGPSPAAAGQPVEVVARLSLTGSVAVQQGDPESISQGLRFDTPSGPVNLLLGAVTPDALAALPRRGTTVPNAVAGGSNRTAPTARAAPAMRLAVHLTLGPAVRLPSPTTVYLIVRAPDSGPMPLAVKRLTIADLPADLVITDADAMVAGRSLRDASRLQIVARASVSGDVVPRPGDYEGNSEVFDVARIPAPISLAIDQAL